MSVFDKLVGKIATIGVYFVFGISVAIGLTVIGTFKRVVSFQKKAH